MTRIGVGTGVVCLAAASYVCAQAQAKQEGPAKRAAPDQSTAVKQDKNKKDGAADKPKVAKKVTVNVVFAGDTEFIDAVKASCQDLRPDKLQDCFAGEMKKAGATPAAVEFSKQLGEPGFVRD